ncbi:MAG: diacylglycerol kinase family protein [Acidimicrobiia bacterium]|nr:diacylglycerol kinase family protein [Acidimicrobiia bacterium]
MSWMVLANPQAGRRAVSADEISSALDAAAVAHDIEVVPDPASMREAVVSVARSGRRLAIAGGDGTVSLAVDALIGAGLNDAGPLGVLPIGTGCDLLRTFGITPTLAVAAHHLAGDRSYRVDVGVAEGEWGRRAFLNVAQAGAGAAAAETAPKWPRRMGPARYPLAFLSRLPGFPNCEIDLAGRSPYRGPGLAVIFANAQFFAGGWNVAPKAILVDGELDVQVFNVKKREAPLLVPKIVKGVHLSNPGVRRRSMPEAELRTEVPWPFEADGDLLGNTPVRLSMIPLGIEIKI